MGHGGATTILSTNQWSTPPMTEKEEDEIHLKVYDYCDMPDQKDANRNAAKAAKRYDPMPAPYAGATRLFWNPIGWSHLLQG